MEVPDRASGTLAIKPEYIDRIMAAKDRMIRQGRWKLVYQPLQSGYMLSLFDLESDPGCQRNMLDQHPDIAAHLWQKLSAWLQHDLNNHA